MAWNCRRTIFHSLPSPAHPAHPRRAGRPSPSRLPGTECLLCARYIDTCQFQLSSHPTYPNIWSVLLPLTSALAHWPCPFGGVSSQNKPADIRGFLPSELCPQALAPISLHLFAIMLALNCPVCLRLGACKWQGSGSLLLVIRSCSIKQSARKGP